MLDNSKELLLLKILENLSGNLNAQKIKQNILSEVAKVFNADRCFFREICSEKMEFLALDSASEYTSSSEIKSTTEIEAEVGFYKNETHEFIIKTLLENKQSFVHSAEEQLKKEDLPFSVRKLINIYGFKSSYGFLISLNDKPRYAFVVQFVREEKHLTAEELNFLRIIANHSSLALQQREIFEKEKRNTEKEKIAAKIIEITRNSLDKKEIKRTFLEEIAKYFNVDRVFIAEFDFKGQKFLPMDESFEYLLGKDIKSYMNYDFSNKYDFSDSTIDDIRYLLEQKQLFVFANREEFIEQNNVSEGLKQHLYEYDVKSALAIPIVYADFYSGALCIHSVRKYISFAEDDIKYLKAITKQVAIAFRHAELYQKEKRISEREKISRNIIESIRSSLDKNELKTSLVNAIGEHFNADRVLFSEFNKEKNIYNPVDEYSEYLSNKKEKSFIGYNWDNPKIWEYTTPLINKKELNIPDWDEYIKTNKKTYEFIKLFEEADVKSSYNIPVLYQDELIGYFCIEFTNRVYRFDEDDYSFVKTICNQTAIGMHQARLYEKECKDAEKARVSKKIVETTRSSLDINEIKQTFLTEVANYTNADRICILEYNENTKGFLPLDEASEFLSGPKIKSLRAYDFTSFSANKLKAYLLHLGCLYFSRREDYIKSMQVSEKEKQHLYDYDIKSSLVLPIIYGKEHKGALLIHGVNGYLSFTKDDIEFLKNINKQAAIAFHQAELYKREKQTAEREKLLRSITETIRNTFDVNEMRKSIITEVGKAFKADRCVMIFFDNSQKLFVPLTKEDTYTSGMATYSYEKLDIENDACRCIRDYYVQGNDELFISDIDKLIPGLDPNIQKTLKSYGAKSNYSVKIKHRNRLLGLLYINYSVVKRELSGDSLALLKSVADQAGIALYQAELLKSEKQIAEREILVRKVIEAVGATLDIQQADKIIIEEVCKAFNADRCYFRTFDKYNNSFLAPNRDYINSTNMESLANKTVNQEDLIFFVQEALKIRKSTPIIVNQELIEGRGLKHSKLNEYFEKCGIKTDIAIPMWDTADELHFLVLHYKDNISSISEEDIALMETLVKQIVIAVDRAKLHESVKFTAKKEKVLNKIINTTKSNLSIKEILLVVNYELSQLYKIKTVQVDTLNIKSCFPHKVQDVNDFNDVLEDKEFFDLIRQHNNQLIIDNINQYNMSENLRQIFEKLNIKSIAVVPINISQNEECGLFLFNENHFVFSEEVDFLEKVAYQVGVAIRETGIYSQTQFVSNVSHELKTPITICKLYTEAILNNAVDESDKDKSLKTIVNNLDRIDAIINNLLYLSKVEQGFKTKKIELVKTDLNKLIQESIVSCKKRADEKNIKIKFKESDTYFAEVNSIMMHQAIVNLINNAVAYSNENTEIQINTEQVADNILINVIDQGHGIKEKDLKNIFERFYRVDSSRDRKSGGTGLGLSIVKTIIKAHGGFMSLKSIVGKGSTFTINLRKI